MSLLIQTAAEGQEQVNDQDQHNDEAKVQRFLRGLEMGKETLIQYSEGSRIVVAARSASVIIQRRTPSFSV